MQPLPRAGALLVSLAIFGTVFALFRYSARLPDEVASRVNNNPQKFRLWTTGMSFSYMINLDPRAADLWLFQSGGGRTLDLTPPLLSPSNSTHYENPNRQAPDEEHP
jgi:hypothetical protein